MKKILKYMQKNCISVLFVIFISIFCLNYIYALAQNALEYINTNANSTKTEYTEEFNEFNKLLSDSEKSGAVSSEKSGASKLFSTFKNLTRMVSNVDDLAIKMPFLKLNASFAKSIGMSHIPGTTFIKLEDGYMYTPSGEYTDEEKNNINKNVKYLSLFKNKLQNTNTDFLYVNLPNKFPSDKNILPAGFYDGKNELCDDLMAKLKNENIPCLDIRENINNDFSQNYPERFYKTDHHWTSANGPWAAQIISEQLNSEYGYNIDLSYFDVNGFTETVYEKGELGSTGENSTLNFTEAEDFSLYIPKKQGSFIFEIPSKNIKNTGGFDAMINYDRLKDISTPKSLYSSYIYANSSYVHIENTLTKDEHKLLIIKDSYANVVIPYLAQDINIVDVIDIRTSQEDHFNSSVLSLIEKNKYDTVIIMYSPYATLNFDRLFIK